MDHDLYFNATRIPGDPTIPVDWSRAEIQGRRDAWAMYELLKSELPEFRDSYFMASGPTPTRTASTCAGSRTRWSRRGRCWKIGAAAAALR
jgi:hypothetical protein